ncbi:MAG: catalase [Actinomycetota bacterium]|nr:catalase [Actinomycetota bacterium]
MTSDAQLPVSAYDPQASEVLTTSQGTPLLDTERSLKVGLRGPTLLPDHHLREKIMHFDHERIPERVVHARGAGAHGVFVANGAAATFCRAGFLAEGLNTRVFVRFSTVVGSRGSADTARDTRGFAVKFYTDEGTFDLVGNNIPVFFIQDGIKFPDLIHAAKPHPDTEIPQAQSAHDTFWDFVSLHTQATHHVLWVMSDRGIPRSYRMMEGFGVHTFRLSDADGKTALVKFHWKPAAGVHSLLWEEAQITMGMDPDFHRRDLADAIEAGNFPSWDLAVQVVPDEADETYQGIDLLDPTKLIPEELAPVVVIGTMTLDRNPSNYFAETEQVAFHPGHLVPGIEPTNDPLLAARLFSYLDTQLTRLGGPNFGQLPINQPQSPVNDNLRDGMHQTLVHEGVAPYFPESLGGGCPFLADPSVAYVESPLPADGVIERALPASFDDHFTQPALFYRSLTAIEQQHLCDAIAFELGKCTHPEIRERELGVLSQVDADLAAEVGAQLGLTPPTVDEAPKGFLSQAVSQLNRGVSPVAGRVIGLVVGSTISAAGFDAALAMAAEAGVTVRLVAPTGGPVDVGGTAIDPDRTYATTRSIEFDAVIILAGPEAELDARVVTLIEESYRHGKAIAFVGGFAASDAGVVEDEGALAMDSLADAVATLIEALGTHRVWSRLESLGARVHAS